MMLEMVTCDVDASDEHFPSDESQSIRMMSPGDDWWSLPRPLPSRHVSADEAVDLAAVDVEQYEAAVDTCPAVHWTDLFAPVLTGDDGALM